MHSLPYLLPLKPKSPMSAASIIILYANSSSGCHMHYGAKSGIKS